MYYIIYFTFKHSILEYLFVFYTHLADYVRQPGFAVTSGSETEYTVTLDPAPTALPDGFGITIVPHVDCGASPTLKIGDFPAIQLKDQKGNVYAAGKLLAGKPYAFRLVGSDFLADSGSGGGGTAQPSHVLAPHTFTNDDGEQTGVMVNRSGAWYTQAISRSGTTLNLRPPQGYYPGDSGNFVQVNDPNWIAANILSGTSIFGLFGSAQPGKRVANGTKTVTAGGQNNQVAGLAFRPAIVLVWCNNLPSQTETIWMTDQARYGTTDTMGVFVRGASVYAFGTGTRSATANDGYYVINDSGFVFRNNNGVTSGTYTWYAWEG